MTNVTSLPIEIRPTPTIQAGLCYVTFAYDAARSIDLNRAEARVHERYATFDPAAQAARP